ncbi:MAG: TasA family protein [Chloroflexota bacterium]
MKKILGLGLVAILVMALVGGGTWAYFSDTETTTGNVLVAGTLNLGLSNSSGGNPTGSTTGTWNVPLSNWAPGDTKAGTLYVYNGGTIDMASVNITFSYVFNDGTPTSVTGWDGSANSDNMVKMITASVATWNGSAQGWQGNALDTIVSGSPYSLGSLPAGAEGALAVTWTFSPTATNGCQNDSVNLTATVNGYQQTNQ